MNPARHAEIPILRALLIWLLVPAAVALAQGDPLSGTTRFFYGEMKDVLLCHPAALGCGGARYGRGRT